MKALATIVWLVSVILGWFQAGQTKKMEPSDSYHAYLSTIAIDAYSVAHEADEPPLEAGEYGRARTTLILLAFAYYESLFAKDVDKGQRRGDKGQSWCLMQVRVSDGAIKMVGDEFVFTYSGDPDGWTGKQLVADRRKCFKSGLHMLRKSKHDCGTGKFGGVGVGGIDYSQYTSGRCLTGGNREAFHRYDLAKRSFGTEPPESGVLVGLGVTCAQGFQPHRGNCVSNVEWIAKNLADEAP